MSERMQTILASVLLVALLVMGIVLAVDALEFESTGACAECVLLGKIKGWEQ